jgi:hypothetical protein
MKKTQRKIHKTLEDAIIDLYLSCKIRKQEDVIFTLKFR